jgi:hypothetical protein
VLVVVFVVELVELVAALAEAAFLLLQEQTKDIEKTAVKIIIDFIIVDYQINKKHSCNFHSKAKCDARVF